MSGKGDAPRPCSVPSDTFAARWSATFRPAAPDDREGTMPSLPLDAVVPDRSLGARGGLVRYVPEKPPSGAPDSNPSDTAPERG